MPKQNLPAEIKFVVGVDEVGRGPLAGPIVFCAFKISINFPTKGFGKIKDSKKLLPKKREEIFAKLEKLKKAKAVDYSIYSVSAKDIDKRGLIKAGKSCIKEVLKNLKIRPSECIVLLDGGLKASKKYKNQKTIIRGDEKERAISFASIIAKVFRDGLMRKLAKKYPKYNFEIHKGYGTKVHRELIKKYGLCPEHRRTFCKNLN
jgi:ribonuclease HII